MRTAEVERRTTETDVSVSLNLDGHGAGTIDTGVGFLDHMLELLACHSRFDLTVGCEGDARVDDHHSVEDIGICMGIALRNALDAREGIARYGNVLLPMDEALMLCAVDLSGRGGLHMDVQYPTEKIGTFDTQLVKEFMDALARNADLTLHFKLLAGENSHHIAEAQFKALGDEVPSTKGML